MTNDTVPPVLRERLRSGDALVGVFVKTSAYQIVEVLARTDLDFIVFDAEHAPFDRNVLDTCLLAARAGGLPALVRLPNHRADTLLGVLDMGATGIMAPHIRSAAEARDLVAATRYVGGRRGISASGRAGDYGGRSLADHIDDQDGSTVVLCQIEDQPGVDNAAEIAAVDGVDCLFIGRADLAVAYGATGIDHPDVIAVSDRVCTAGRTADTPVGAFLPDISEAATFRDKGVSLFVVGSDQSLVKAGADGLCRRFRESLA